MKFKSGDMVLVVGGVYPQFIGRVLTLTTVCVVYENSWDTDPPQFIVGFSRLPVSFNEETLRLIKDGDLALDETSDLTLPAQPETTSTPC